MCLNSTERLPFLPSLSCSRYGQGHSNAASLSILPRCQGDGVGVWEGSCALQGKALSPLQHCWPNTLSNGASKRLRRSDTALSRGTMSFGAGLCAGSQSLRCSWRSPSSCPFSWLPVLGRRLCFGVHPEAIPSIPSSAILHVCHFSHGLYGKGR